MSWVFPSPSGRPAARAGLRPLDLVPLFYDGWQPMNVTAAGGEHLQVVGLPLEIRPAAENWSWMSVAGSGSAHHGGRRGRPYPWLQAATLTDLIDRRTNRRPRAGLGGLPASSHRPSRTGWARQ